MSFETANIDTIRDDFEMVTSDQPDVIQRALAAEGQAKEGDDQGDESDSSAVGSDATPESGGDSDSPVGDQVDGEGDEPKPEDDDKIVEAEIDGKKVKTSAGIHKRFRSLSTKVSERDQTITELTRQLTEARAVAAKPADQQKPADQKVADTATAAAEVVIDKFVAAPEPKDTDLNTDGSLKFPTYGDFIKGHAAWSRTAVEQATEHMSKQTAKLVQQAVDKLQSDLKAQAVKESTETEVQKIETAFRARQAKVAETRKDFNDVVKLNKNNVQVSDPVKRIIFLHAQGAELQYHLASNPAIASSLLALPVELQAAEAGAIIAKLDAPKTPKPKTVSEGVNDTGIKPAAKPPAPLPRGGTSGGRGTVSKISVARASTMDVDDYMEGRKNGTIR